MSAVKEHDWNLSLNEARGLQTELAENIRIEPLPADIEIIAGFDLAYIKNQNLLVAGMVVLNYPDLTVIEEVFHTAEITFPYITGFLSFREAPALLKLISNYKNKIDLFVFDGHGMAHPRGLGIASHIGVIVDKPSIGCAKKRLVGEYNEPGLKRGNSSNLFYKNNIVGCALRTRDRIKPVFISIGHRAKLADAVKIMLVCGNGYRIPEPTRLAHLAVARYKNFINS